MGTTVLMTPFAEWFDAELKARGVKRSQAAAFIGTRPQTISAWFLHGAQPSPELCQRVADYLHVPVEEVLRHAGHLATIPDDPTLNQRPEARLSHRLVAVLQKMTLEQQNALAGHLEGVLAPR